MVTNRRVSRLVVGIGEDIAQRAVIRIEAVIIIGGEMKEEEEDKYTSLCIRTGLVL